MKIVDEILEAHPTQAYCQNPIANSILNLYASRAEEKSIKTTFHVNVPEGIGIENIDLTCVLGNALENALKGACDCRRKK